MRHPKFLCVLSGLLIAGLAASTLMGQPPQTRPGAGSNPPGVQPGEQPGVEARQQPGPPIQPGDPAPQSRDWPRLRQAPDQPPKEPGRPDAPGRRNLSQQAAPEVRIQPGIAPPSSHWYLGVYPERAPRGVRVDRVIGGTPAHRYGLESGDYILDVGGYVVGDYQGRYYPLSMAIDYGAGPTGWAELLVWNKRTFAEETLWVQFRRR